MSPGEAWARIGYKVEVEDLQGKDRQRNGGENRQADHQHLRQVARQQIGCEPADVPENNLDLPGPPSRSGKGVIEQDHGGGFARHVRAPQTHRNPDVGLP